MVPKFELNKAESIAFSVKITKYPTNYDPNSSKMDQKMDQNGSK